MRLDDILIAPNGHENRVLLINKHSQPILKDLETGYVRLISRPEHFRRKVMERWDCTEDEDVQDKAVDEFIAEIKQVCKKHGMSIGHEDQHGSFLIEKYSDSNIEWLEVAMADWR